MGRLGGQVLANKVQAVIDGKLVYIGYIDGPDYVFTPEGHEIAAAIGASPSVVVEASMAAEPAGPVESVKTVRRTRNKLVESTEPDPVE